MKDPCQNWGTLPALRSLGDLADLRPIIVVDTREKQPLRFERLRSVRGTLVSGDYSIAGVENLFAIERKSTTDLISCCVGENRARFERELHRLRGFRFTRLLVVGARAEIETHNYRSRVSPKTVLHSLAAWEARYNVPVVFSSPFDAAEKVESWAFWFAREVVRGANDLLRGHRVYMEKKQ